MKSKGYYNQLLGTGGCATCDHSKNETRDYSSLHCEECLVYSKHTKKWSRIDIIGQNGNEGLHYDDN